MFRHIYILYHTKTFIKLIKQIDKLLESLSTNYGFQAPNKLFTSQNFDFFCKVIVIIVFPICLSEHICVEIQWTLDHFEKYKGKQVLTLNFHSFFTQHSTIQFILLFQKDKSISFWLRQMHDDRFESTDPLHIYNPAILVVRWILSKISICVWIYGTLIVIVVCKALTEILYVFHESVKSYLYQKGKLTHCFNGRGHDDILRDRFLDLQKLMDSAGKLLGPLVLACYGINMYYIITKVCTLYF